MKFTGEREIPGKGDVDVLNEHRARYRFAQRFCSGKMVLDVACGAGFGSDLLAENAQAVFGVDLSREAVEYARRHYGSPTVHFAQSDCLALPFPSGQFGLVVAFEILEHLEDSRAFLTELRRVLHASGLLLLSTPNRLYYTKDRGEVNPFHRREFSFAELEEILRPLFPYRSILFENHIAGLLLSAPQAKPNWKAPAADSIFQEPETAKPRRQESQRAAHYFVGLCASRPLDPVFPLLYLPSTGNVLREREIHIRSLTKELREQVAQAQASARLLEERTHWAEELDKQISQKDSYILQLQADYESKAQWALRLQQDVEQARSALQKLQQQYEKRTAWALHLDEELKQRTAWALNLDEELKQRTAWALNLDEELKQRTAWALNLDEELKQRTAWALDLEKQLKQRIEDLCLLYGSLWYRIGKNLRFSPTPASDQPQPKAAKQDG